VLKRVKKLGVKDPSKLGEKPIGLRGGGNLERKKVLFPYSVWAMGKRKRKGKIRGDYVANEREGRKQWKSRRKKESRPK